MSVIKFALFFFISTFISACGQSTEDPGLPAPNTPAILITPTTGLATHEDGHTIFFVIVLNSRPTADVTIPIHSSNTHEGMLIVNSITFTPDTWATPQSVSILGVDDDVVDQDTEYLIITDPAISDDTGYNGLDADDIQVINVDNDVPGIRVTPTTGLATSEAGHIAFFVVVLDSMPSADVTIPLSSSNINEGRVLVDSITFTPNNWSTPQSVSVLGVDDDVVDGDVSFSIITAPSLSDDSSYDGVDADDVIITNVDNDDPSSSPAPTPGIIVSPITGIVTSEDGNSVNINIALNSPPTNNVTISLQSSDIGEGTVNPASLSFTTTSWNTPKTFTITGVDDAIVDGDMAYTISFIVTSSDSDYNGFRIPALSAVNQDNDSPSPPPPTVDGNITITATTAMVTSENGTTAQFTIVLDSQPTEAVTLSISSSNTNEGTVAPEAVVFTTSNWNTPRTITITGVDDTVVDGDINYSINIVTFSSDLNYNNLTIAPIGVTNQDNDSTPPPPVETAGISVTPTSGHITSEAGAASSFTVVLDKQPTNRVTVNLSSSDTSEGIVNPTRLIFSTTNWSTAQTVTVTGVDDAVVDGNMDYTITFSVSSSDTSYNAMAVDPVPVTNLDNDVPQTPGITVVPDSGLTTSEAGTTATFSLVLYSEPTQNVTINISSNNTAEGTVAPAELVFTAANWNSPQSATVTGVDDSVVDGDVSYAIEFTVTSTDADYDGMAITAIDAVNQDNDVMAAGVVITPTTGLQTSENLDSTDFTIKLASQPAANVTIAIASTNTAEGTVAPASIVFSTTDWETAQTISITGVDDAVLDGNVTYQIEFTLTSGDTGYDGFVVAPLEIVNLDNETPTPPTTANYTLYIEPGTVNITPSTISGNGAASLRIWGYSLSNSSGAGMTPGPLLEAVVGQTLLIEVHNDHLLPHSFVIEGLLSGTSEIPSGESMQYEITPTEAGVYRYGDGDMLGVAMGLVGALVVKPADGSDTAWSGGPAYDQERTWVVTDMDSRWNSNLIASTIDQTNYNPNYFLINGQNGFAASENPDTIIEGNVGQQVLVRIVNSGQYDQSLHFHAAHFKVISQGGVKMTDIAEAPQVTTINVKRGSTAMILYPIEKVGSFPIHVHSANMETGNGVYLNGVMSMIIGH